MTTCPRGGRPPLLPRHRAHPGRRLRAGVTAQHQHDRVAGHPGRRARDGAPSGDPPARGGSSTPSTTSPGRRTGPGWFIVLTNDEARTSGSWLAPTTGSVADDWREIVPRGPGCASRTSMPSPTCWCSASAPRPRPWCGCCRSPGPDPSGGDLLATGAGSSPRPRARRRSGWAPTPSRRSPAPGRPHLHGDAVAACCRSTWPDRRDSAQAGAGPRRLRSVPLRHLRCGPPPTTAPGPDLRGARRASRCPPPVLYGYGAYEISIDPAFSHHRLSLLDRGFVFAVAHVRGGGEMGRAWYETAAWSTSQHLRRLHRLRPSPGGRGHRRPGAMAGRRFSGRTAGRRRGQRPPPTCSPPSSPRSRSSTA